ncbi:MAG TPA: pitrilysin family protein [Polyangiaceae bacterium]|nr:pitrilysin family protein [Polyangiaceae bacterium]
MKASAHQDCIMPLLCFSRRSALALLTTLPLACEPQAQRPAPASPTPPATASPAAPVARANALEPPPPGLSPNAPFPKIEHQRLENGLELRVVERHVHPIVELRLVVRSGSATDGEKPGLAAVAGELLKAGGVAGLSPQKLVQRADALGTDLSILTDRDSTRIALNVTSGDLDAALELLSKVAFAPSFQADEFQKLRAREIERVKSSARGSAGWAASMLLYRELFDLPTGIHPYSRMDAMPNELAQLSLADCKAWHKAQFVPSNAALVIAGDVTPQTAQAAANKWFGAWKGGEAPAVSISQPFAPQARNVYIADRPGSGQSQVLVGVLGAELRSPDWVGLTLANQVLGGGVSSRLFIDVREKRSLAYSTGASLNEMETGPSALVLSAGTQTPKTPDTVAALLENLEKMAARAPEPSEVDTAARFLADGFVFKLETVGSLADLTAHLYARSLPDEYYDDLRARWRTLTPAEVGNVAQRYYAKTPVIVVAGDGATLGPLLAQFGPVSVLDPENGFSLKRSYPKR